MSDSEGYVVFDARAGLTGRPWRGDLQKGFSPWQNRLDMINPFPSRDAATFTLHRLYLGPFNLTIMAMEEARTLEEMMDL